MCRTVRGHLPWKGIGFYPSRHCDTKLTSESGFGVFRPRSQLAKAPSIACGGLYLISRRVPLDFDSFFRSFALM